MRVEFQKSTLKKKKEKLAIFKSSSQLFGSMYFNLTLHICLGVLLVVSNKSPRICLIVFGDTVIQSLKSGKTRKSGFVPISRQENLADLLSNSCKTRRNTAKDEQKYQPIFLLVFSGSRVTKSQVY